MSITHKRQANTGLPSMGFFFVAHRYFRRLTPNDEPFEGIIVFPFSNRGFIHAFVFSCFFDEMLGLFSTYFFTD